ncbi:MAG: DUF2779 domain-containing protein [bacterium]
MLSKSNFMAYFRCTCELWLIKQRPDLAPPVDAALQRVFDQGNIVDAWAQKLFPDAVNVNGFGVEGAEKTKKAIAKGAKALLQPTFIAGKINCRADILVRNSDDSWDLYEVKSSTKPADEHTWDMAFQRACIEDAGIKLRRTYLVHISNKYVCSGAIEPEKLFTQVNLTKQVLDTLPFVRKEIPRSLEVLGWGHEPWEKLLKMCTDPEKCEFLQCYAPHIASEQVYAIATSLPKDRLCAYLKRGILKPEQVPADLLAELDPKDYLSKKHTKPVIKIDKKAIARELGALEYPLYFLDYETYFPAIPMFDGYRPYQQCVFQYSLHVLESFDAPLKHYEFLADTFADPASEVCASLARNIGPKGNVVSWNMQFEASRNSELAEMVPSRAAFLADVNERMYDLMMIVKKGYYVDSRFEGIASLKKVLPVMCPELSYDALAIHEGGTASASWAVLTDPAIGAREKAQLRADMLDYCGLDTFAMVEIFRRFSGTLSK